MFDWTILKYQQSQLATPPARGIVSVILSFSSPVVITMSSAMGETHKRSPLFRFLVLEPVLQCHLLLPMLIDIQVLYLRSPMSVTGLQYFYLYVHLSHFSSTTTTKPYPTKWGWLTL